MVDGVRTPLVSVISPVRQTTGTQTGFLAPAARAGQQAASQRLTEQQKRATAAFELQDAVNKQRIQSVAIAANELLPSLESKDFDAVNKLLDLRRQSLIAAGKPTQDTDEFKKLLASDPDLATSQARNAVESAKLLGLLKTPEGGSIPFQLGTTRTVKKDGKLANLTEVFNRNTGQITLSETPLEGQIVSRDLGETPEEKRKREVLTKAQKDSASFAQKVAASNFPKIGIINSAMNLYDEGIRLLDSGAGAGFIEGRLPSIKDVSIQLDVLQGELGLNVIQQTTFGQLSNAELAFALSTALPKNLSEEGLKDWLKRKRDAQQKLLSYITDATIYLGTPGNTISGWLALQKQRQKDREEAKRALKKPLPSSPEIAPTTEPRQPQQQAAPRRLQDFSVEDLANLSIEELEELRRQAGDQ